MKILHLSTSDLDGGGSVVTYRLHKALLNSNINSKMLVFDKFSRDDDSIVCKSSNLDSQNSGILKPHFKIFIFIN